MIEILVAKVFNDRNYAHVEHWKTKSYAKHVALGSFYDDVVDKLDTIVETYQGAFGLISVPALPSTGSPKDFVTFLTNEMKWISDNRKEISKGVTALENLVDGLLETYLTTIYKLKNLS